MKFLRYLLWRANHAHIWKQQGEGAYSCRATHDGYECGKWYGEQLWS